VKFRISDLLEAPANTRVPTRWLNTCGLEEGYDRTRLHNGATGMTSFVGMCRGAGLAVVVPVGLGLGACAYTPNPHEVGLVSSVAPGSQQDFVVNVGDRVFFAVDSSELTPQARSTLDKQAQWLQTYNRYNFTIEGHADVRGTREYNLALGAWRAIRCAIISPRAASTSIACIRFRTARNGQPRSAMKISVIRRTAAR
jgi:peptidoglycan-associated lipoprotein